MNLGGAPHPHRDQVHIQLAHFRPRAVTPPLSRDDQGFLVVVTISIGFGSAVGLVQEGGWCWIIYLVEPRRDKSPGCIWLVWEATYVRQSGLFYANIRQQKVVKSDKMG